MRLTRYYAMHLCSPSRAAMLTGLHPIRTGMQHSMITSNQPWGLDTRFELLPQKLGAARKRGAFEEALFCLVVFSSF